MSVKFVGVMPYVFLPYYHDCVATMHPDFKDNVLFVDNTVDNKGIMWGHNQGVLKMYEEDADWLVVISAGIRFGAPGGLDFVEQLDQHPDALLVHGSGMWFDEIGR